MGLEKAAQLLSVTVPDDPSEDWFVFAARFHSILNPDVKAEYQFNFG